MGTKKTTAKRQAEPSAGPSAEACAAHARAALTEAIEHLEDLRRAFRRLPPVVNDELRLRLRASIELNSTQMLIERALLVLS